MKYFNNNWSFKDLKKFLESYGFKHGYTNGSHYYYNGTIEGKERVVQVINNKYERKTQSQKTMKLAFKHLGIKKEIF